MRKTLVALALIAGLAGCVTVNKTVLMDRSSSPVPASDVYVFLPPGYGDDEDRTYPVLYMQDGQNVFARAGGDMRVSLGVARMLW